MLTNIETKQYLTAHYIYPS